MARVATILLLINIIVFQNLLCQNQPHGDSWQQCKENGKGTIVVYWHVVEPSAYLKDGVLEGIEINIMQSFKQYVADNYNIELAINWIKFDGFQELLPKLGSINSVGEFTIGNISITEQRKELIQFSPPFIPDMNVLVSSTDITHTSSKIVSIKIFGVFSNNINKHIILRKKFRG